MDEEQLQSLLSSHLDGFGDLQTVAKNILAHHGLEPCLTYLLGAMDFAGFTGRHCLQEQIRDCRQFLKAYRDRQ